MRIDEMTELFLKIIIIRHHRLCALKKSFHNKSYTQLENSNKIMYTAFAALAGEKPVLIGEV